MTEAEMYRKMAAWIDEHGFSPEYADGGCGCFLRANRAIGTHYVLLDELRSVLSVYSLFASDLRRAGWRKGAASTRDAVAACLIAADLAS